MNTRLSASQFRGAISRPGRWTAMATLAFASVLTVQGFAQSERVPKTDRAAARAETQADAAALFAEGRDADAVALIASTNFRAADSPGWHTETAGHLLQLAWRFSTEGRTELADRVALLSLAETAVAVKAAGDSEGNWAAAALLTAALIQERFLGDIEAAKASLRRAREFDPDNESVRESLERFDRAERLEAARIATIGEDQP